MRVAPFSAVRPASSPVLQCGVTRDPASVKQAQARLLVEHRILRPQALPDQLPATVAGAQSLASFTCDDSSDDLDIAYLDASIEGLETIRTKLLGRSATEQAEVLRREPIVQGVLRSNRVLDAAITSLGEPEQAALLATIAAGQENVLTLLPEGDFSDQLKSLAADLVRVQQFYDSLGGIVGYQAKCLELIRAGKKEEREGDAASSNGASPSAREAEIEEQEGAVRFLVPEGPNLQDPGERAAVQRAVADGLRAVPVLAEIYPLGGAGDRLGLVCEDTGEPLPAAMLPYCGRPLLEGLLRDLAAREYLAFRLSGVQTVTPVAIMTSPAKGNHGRVARLLAERASFGRPRESFRLFCQPLVPVLEAESGDWVLPKPLAPSLKPGGHGAIWKLMHDHGIFAWLADLGKEAALVRQISNPMAATDATLLALAGTGHRDGRAFGFASCERLLGAAEGMNVLQERRVRAADGGWEYEVGVSNVEYTEFQRLGISDAPVAAGSSQSCFPANTNILYVGLAHAAAAIARSVDDGGAAAALPGLIFNLQKRITYTPAAAPLGGARTVRAGRLESTMQNLADALAERVPRRLVPGEAARLQTFAVFNKRRYVTSSAKRKRQPRSVRVHQTPEGSFLDLMRNARDLLTQHCSVDAPPLASAEDYVAAGCIPAFVFVWLPALGPLWDVVGAKVSGGALAAGAEVELEVAELVWRDVRVTGSLLVRAECPLGRTQPPAPDGTGGGIAYSARECGRAWLERVHVDNAGVDYSAAGTCVWRRSVARREACCITLCGCSAFQARDVTLRGDVTFTVPDGYLLTVAHSPTAARGFKEVLEPLDPATLWSWRYEMGEGGAISLTLDRCRNEEPSRAVADTCAAPVASSA